MNKYLHVFVLCLIAGCASFDGTGPIGGPTLTVKTFNAPVARVKPAVVSTIVQMGMSVSSIETRGGREVLKALPGTLAQGDEADAGRIAVPDPGGAYATRTVLIMPLA